MINALRRRARGLTMGLVNRGLGSRERVRRAHRRAWFAVVGAVVVAGSAGVTMSLYGSSPSSRPCSPILAFGARPPYRCLIGTLPAGGPTTVIFPASSPGPTRPFPTNHDLADGTDDNSGYFDQLGLGTTSPRLFVQGQSTHYGAVVFGPLRTCDQRIPTVIGSSPAAIALLLVPGGVRLAELRPVLGPAHTPWWSGHSDGALQPLE